MKNLYAISIYAKSAMDNGSNPPIIIGASYAFASTEKEAKQSAVSRFLLSYPENEWTGHHTVAVLIPQTEIKENFSQHIKPILNAHP